MSSRNPQNRNILMKKRLREKVGKTETLTHLEYMRLNMPTFAHNPCSNADMMLMRGYNNKTAEKIMGKKQYERTVKDDLAFTELSSLSNVELNSF